MLAGLEEDSYSGLWLIQAMLAVLEEDSYFCSLILYSPKNMFFSPLESKSFVTLV